MYCKSWNLLLLDFSDSDEDDIEYMQVDELDEDDQYTVQIAHGWDFTNRGGQLQPYPSVPQICVPMPNYEGRVQVNWSWKLLWLFYIVFDTVIIFFS